ncbi:MAG: tetratricopeptide repeat protein [Phycisphaerae bacterium]
MQKRTPFLLAALALVPFARAADTPAQYSPQLALSLYHQGKYAEDESLCNSAIAAIEKTGGPTSPKLARPLDDLASIALRRGRFADAKPLLDRAESLLDKSSRDGALAYAHLCINKGWYWYSLGDTSRAEAIFKEGRDLEQKYEKSPTVDLAELINNLALTYADNEEGNESKVDEGRAMLFKSWEMRKKLTGEQSPETAESLNNIGMHLLFHPDGDADIPTAMNTLVKAADAAEKAYGKDNPETAMSYTNLATAYHLLQNDHVALLNIQKAIPITEKYLGKENPDRAYELQVLGQIQQKMGKTADAEANFTEALAITKKCFGPTNIAVAAALDYLATLYEATGDTEKQTAIQKQITTLRGRDI